VAAVEVEVAAAEGSGCHFEHDVGGVFQFGDGAVFDDNLFASGQSKDVIAIVVVK
jgi:hypothetical protein